MKRTLEKIVSFVPKRLAEVKHILSQLIELNRNTTRYAYYQSEDLKAQITYLRTGEAGGPAPKIGYDLRWMAARLRAKTHVVDPARPFICSIAVGHDYQRQVAPCLESRRRYAEKHGYNWIELLDLPLHFNRPVVWAKMPFLYQAMSLGHERLFFLDADAVITNTTIRLEPFFEQLERSGKPMLIAEGTTGINAGVFFLRRSPAAMVLLDLIWKHEGMIHAPLAEQDAMRDLLHRFSLDETFLVAERSRDFNSFPVDGPHRKVFRDGLFDPGRLAWQPGDFLIHLTSYRGEELYRAGRKYSALAI